MEIEDDDSATPTSQSHPHNLPTAQQHHVFLSNVLSVPLQFLVSRVRNKREAEVILDISRSATSVDCMLKNYEATAAQTQALHEAWDMLWLSREPLLVTAIPLIGQRMSEVNQQRAMLIKKLDAELCKLQVMANSLLQFMDMNSTIIKELKAEGVERLAAEKMLLVDLEQELAARVRAVCAGESLKDYSYMSHFLAKLMKDAPPLIFQRDPLPDPRKVPFSEEPKMTIKNPEKQSYYSSETTAGRSIDLPTVVFSREIESQTTLMASSIPLMPCLESSFLKSTLEIATAALHELKHDADSQGIQQSEKSLKCFAKSSDSVERDAKGEKALPCSSEAWPIHASFSEEHSSFTCGYHTHVEHMVLDSSSSASEEQLPGKVVPEISFGKTQQQELSWRHVNINISQSRLENFQVANEAQKMLYSPDHAEAEEINQPEKNQILVVENTTCHPGTSNIVDKIPNATTVQPQIDEASEALGPNNLQQWSKGFSKNTSSATNTYNSLDDQHPGLLATCDRLKCNDGDVPGGTRPTSHIKNSSSTSKHLSDKVAESDQYQSLQQNHGDFNLKSHLHHILQPGITEEQEFSVSLHAKSSWDPAKRLKVAKSENEQVDTRHQLESVTSENPSEEGEDLLMHEIELYEGGQLKTGSSKTIDAHVVRKEETDGLDELLGKSSNAKCQSSRWLGLCNCEAKKDQSHVCDHLSTVNGCYNFPEASPDRNMKELMETNPLYGISCFDNKDGLKLETGLICNCMKDESTCKAVTQKREIYLPVSLTNSNEFSASLLGKLLDLHTEESEIRQKLSYGCPSTPNVSLQTSAISSDDLHLNFNSSMSGDLGTPCLQSDDLHHSTSESVEIPNKVLPTT